MVSARLRRTAGYGAAALTGFAGSATAGLVTAPPAAANVTYNRSGAANYAETWWDTKNPNFAVNLGNDCTNYVSQVLNLGGGTGQNSQWRSDAYSHTVTWTAVPEFVQYHINDHYEAGIHYATLYDTNEIGTQTTTPASVGDPYVFNWNDGGAAYDHLTVAMGPWYFNGYYDQPWNFQWNNFSGFYDSADSHSTNRTHMPWNLGWFEAYYLWTSSNRQAQANGMAFKVVHINT